MTYVSLSLNRFPFVFLQAKEPAGEDKTVPDSIKSNLEEFTKEQIQVCSEEEVSMTQSQWDIPRIGELGSKVGRGGHHPKTSHNSFHISPESTITSIAI